MRVPSSSFRWLECILTDFNKSVDFSLAELGVSDFDQAIFRGESDFVLTTAKTAKFTHATFLADVSFNQSCINGSALFEAACFNG